MASRWFDVPTFQFRTGLLSTGDLTAEERARLFEEEMLLSLRDVPEPEPIVEPPPEPEPEPEPEKPLVKPQEPVATPEEEDRAERFAEDITRTLPAEEPPLVKPKEEEERREEVAKPLVKGTLEPPAVKPKDETYTALRSGILEAAARRRAELAAEAEQTGQAPVELEQAMFAQVIEQAINSPEMWNASVEDFKRLQADLAKNVFTGNVQAVVSDDDWQKLVERRKDPNYSTPQSIIPPYREEVLQEGERSEIPTVRESVSKGVTTTRQLLWAGIEAVGEVAGVETPTATRKRRYYQAIGNVMPEGTKLSDIESFGDALQWAMQTTAEQGPLMALPISGAVVGGVIARSIGATTGAFGSSWLLGTGEIQSANKQVSEDQKAGLSTLIGGTAVAALDSILPQRIGATLVRTFGKEQAEEIAQRMLLLPSTREITAALGRVAKEGGKSAGIEALTEGTQAAIQELATSVETGTPIQPGLLYRILENAAAGALVGGQAGTVTGTAQEVAARQAPIRELGAAQFVTPTDVVATGRMSPTQAGGDVIPRPRQYFSQPAQPFRIPKVEGEAPTPVAPTPAPVNRDGEEQEFLLPSGRITSKFGPRQTFRTANGQMASSNHAGVDIALPSGAPAPAGADGIVVFADRKGGYGNQVVLQHSDGTTSSYSHLSKILVEVGDEVGQGEQVGKVGKTGNTTGPHLHLERRDRQGRPVNPLTGGIVATREDPETGEFTDDTEWEADNDDFVGNTEEDWDQEDLDSTFTDVSGQVFADEEAAPEAVAPEAAPQPTPPLVAKPTFRRQPEHEVIHEEAESRLVVAKGRNLAAQELARDVAVEAEVRSDELAQPLANEEPVYADAAEGSEVIGFVNPETGAFRPIAEPAPPAAGVVPEAAVAPDEVAPAQPDVLAQRREMARREDEALAAASRTPQALLGTLPRPGPRASADTRAGRLEGQRSGVGLVPELTEEQLATQSKAFRTAYNIGLREGQNALATANQEDFVSTPTQGVATTPEIPEGSVAPTVEEVQVPQPVPTPSITPETAAVEQQQEIIPSEREQEIQQTVEEIEDKLFDYETEGTKSVLKAYMQRLVKRGILAPNELESLAYMFKDRDMGVEDITSEIRTSVQIWAEEQLRAAPAVGSAQVVQTRYGPIEEPAPGDLSLTARIARQRIEEARNAGAEQGRRRVDDEDGQGRTGGAGELQAPPVEADGTVVLQHYSDQEGLTTTDPGKWGRFKQSFSPRERAAVASAPPRTYFGIATGQRGGYKNEFVGRTEYEARIPIERLYDVATDADGLWIRGNPSASEHAIKDAGYAGYWHKNPELGLVAVVFEAVPVKAAAKPQKAQQKPKQKPKPAPKPEPKKPERRQRTPQEVREQRQIFKDEVQRQVVAVLRQMQIDGRPDLTVEVVDAFEKAAQGSFDPNTMRIKIAAFDTQDARQTTRHEVIHWAREARVFDREEWAILAKWARNTPQLINWAKAHYPNETEEEQVEEAVAEGFARWRGGDLSEINLSDGSKVVSLFEKFLRVLKAIRDAFTGRGITRGEINAAADLLRALESGQQIKKADARRKPPKVTFGRKPYDSDLSRSFLGGNVSGEQHHFLRNNRQPSLQKAWHGSANVDIEAFKLDFIGTGEGAQAFGWGLYFAQKKEVADWYRSKLARPSLDPVNEVVLVDGKTMLEWGQNEWGGTHNNEVYEVADRIHTFLSTGGKPYNGWLDALEGAFLNEMDLWLADAVATEDMAEQIALAEAEKKTVEVFRTLARQAARKAEIKLKEYPYGGKLYEVEVPENDELINLDNKLKDQTPKVKSALETIRDHMASVGILNNFEDLQGDFWEWDGYHLVRVFIPRMLWQELGPTKGSEDLANAIWSGQSSMATSIWLRDLGIVGSRYKDRDSRMPGESETYNYVIFDDTQIQLKAKYRVIQNTISNSPLSDPSIPDPSMWRRIHDHTMGLLGALAGKDVDSADNLVDAFRRKITQRYRQIQKTQARSAEMLGVSRLPSGQNPMEMITADERGYKLQFLTDNMIRPMANEMANRGVTMDDLGLYLYARHAPARNARIAAINKEFNDPSDPKKAGSGMSNPEAAKIIKDFADEGRLDDLVAVATYIDQMIAFAQQERINSGLISHADVAAGFQSGDFYVPLRGNEEIEPELEMDFALAARRGGGFSTSGKEGHRMFGRSSRAGLEEIVGYTITQAHQAIDRGYRNRVAQSMKAMFENTPDPEFVKIDRVKRVAVWNRAKGQVEYQMQTRVVDPKEQQRTIYVKESGKVSKMTFNDTNPSAMRFVKAAKNLGLTELPRILELMSVFTRLWSKANTQWNVDFILANATKDVQTGVLNASTLDVKGLRRSIIKNIASMRPLMGAWMGSRAAAGAGFGSGNVWFETFAEFEANGGKLNYGQIEPLEDAIRTARREIRNAKRSPMNPLKLAGHALDWIDHTNSAFENMTRLAAYKALRDRGIPAKQAAEAVRELTTNFQQHGEWGPKFNAAYGFANASVIGGARFAYTVATHPALIAGLLSLGMIEDLLNSMWDDDEWDRYTEEDKHANFILLLPDSFGFDIKIPAGYGLNAFITAGRKFSELWRGKKKADGTKLSVLDAASDAAMGFVNSFAPITGATFFNIVTPTIGDPVVNIYQNQNNWGRPIMPPQAFRKEQEKPDSQLAFDNTGQFWKTMATAMNAIGGGNEVIPGWTPLDISPESYKHVTQETVGGAGRSLLRTANLIQKLATGEDVGPNDVPVARRFMATPYGASNDAGEQLGAFYQRLGDARTTIAQAKEIMARYGKESATYQEFRKDNEPLIEFADKIESAEKRLRELNTAENAAERGANRVNGLKRRDRKAIFKATKYVVPAGRALKDEEVAKIKARTKQKKEALAASFNELYLAEVMD